MTLRELALNRAFRPPRTKQRAWAVLQLVKLINSNFALRTLHLQGDVGGAGGASAG
eukprot:CAMPEP_0198343428 /NCGR_PEP_ID=MMETSP1450-20131203/60117_1 /TAXON_ID=753684 ORGANISM="Madagascaria erythrocladiodes, Strain CCMP3234" /NCGR_SAMPLE_ID=MMETSP1450 /ASSEMBLY_ACC=CAM_ASM_001115 /LENGTH=55 /DNA_ID=CAMNT_0044048605 /DNA_START=28 /DNA_END=191 /DNA_ORIENTATION=+